MIRYVELAAGPVGYLEVGEGPTLVFTTGVPMNESQWRKVLPRMTGYRCIVPILPLGGHRRPMKPDADLSGRGVARLLGEFCAALELDDVTLVLNDWGGGQYVLLEPEGRRIARLVLVACEAFDNFPPPSARPMAALARVPGGIWLLTRLMRIAAFRRARFGYGGMAVHPIPDEIVLDWFAPATRSRAIRRDFAKFASSAPPRAVQLRWSAQVGRFEGPVLVVWATADRLMPREHGRRLTELFADAQLVEVADSGTLIPEDQPERLAAELHRFLIDTASIQRR